ncbi:hypothetical protein BLX42_20225 [Pseudomonas sp. SG-MS2]|jgi:hypothetical protein|nr:hypothetical protein BLX42_20225 [Pseudomonas sp. SG-MS2]
MTTGRKLLAYETGSVLPGTMPIEWPRFYASDLAIDSVLGRGWVLPWKQSLRRSGGFVYHTDKTVLNTIGPGERSMRMSLGSDT